MTPVVFLKLLAIFVVIAIGWIAYRPILAFAIIGIGLALAAALIFLRRRSAPAAAPNEPVVLGRG